MSLLENITHAICAEYVWIGANGDLRSAKDLMGRPYQFKGKVVKGKGLGRTIGWPTANLEVDGRKFLPRLGVYAALVWINKSQVSLPAVMNLGPQPTIDPESPSAVEVHLLNMDINLENSELLIEPVKRLRSQKRFNGLDELSSQIKLDAKNATTHFRMIEKKVNS